MIPTPVSMASFLASQSLRLHNIWHHSRFIIILACSIQLIACSTSKKLSVTNDPEILSDSNLLNAHVGISIYDPSTNKYLYSHQADKYFIPASNTKLFTCYAAMKHLGDSLVGGRHFCWLEDGDTTLIIIPSGDPTFLHKDFPYQPLFDYAKEFKLVAIELGGNKFDDWGYGWTWNDYDAAYMVERSALPTYGNLFHFFLKGDTLKSIPKPKDFWVTLPDNGTGFDRNTLTVKSKKILLKRDFDKNIFSVLPAQNNFTSVEIPIRTDWLEIDRILEDTLKVQNVSAWFSKNSYLDSPFVTTIHSQPTDSLLKPMMHRSDNFFAEQTLLMVSNEMTGVMNDTKIIDSLLKTDLKDLPQKPRWVDGSGLSRYNLFSPNDMVHVLTKMKNEFDWNRITTILPTGGEGTLSNYYINLKDKIFAKTGTLSNNIALSGFLITRQNKTLIFSVLVNNHMGNTTQIRRAVERFLTDVSNKY